MGQRIKPENIPPSGNPDQKTDQTDIEGRESIPTKPSHNPDVVPEQRGEI